MDFIRSTVDQARSTRPIRAHRHDRHDLPQKAQYGRVHPPAKPQTAPPPQPVPQRSGEPVGEPIETPRSQPVPSGFTMQIGGLDTVPMDSTQGVFMSAHNAVRPRADRPARPPHAPVPPAAPCATAGRCRGGPSTKTPLLSGMPRQEENRQTGELLLPHRQRDDVDQLVDTLTGRISLTPPAACRPGPLALRKA